MTNNEFIEECCDALLEECAVIRNEQGLSQKKLADMCGVMQPVIARAESRRTNPTIYTLQRMLLPLGYRLTIERIGEHETDIY